MKDWLDIFKEALEEERIPLPEGDWEVMEDLLNHHIRRRKNRGMALLFAPVFVVVAAGVYLFVKEDKLSHRDAPQIAVNEQFQEQISDSEPADTTCAEQALRIYFSKENQGIAESKHDEERITQEEAKEEVIEAKVPINDTDQRGNVGEDFNWPQADPPTSPKNNKLTFRFGSSFLLGNTLSSSSRTFVMSPFDVPESYLSSNEPYPLSYRHNPPITIGLSLSYYLSDRFLVTSGLDYSFCLSRVKLSDNTVEDQKAHYLGIPVHLDWVPIRTNKVDFYVGAGAKVSKCLYADLGGRKLRDANLYYSAICLAGFRYEPVRNIGLFVEPQYSFNLADKKSEVHTAITDSRTLFSFRAGVSVSIK